MYLNARKNVRGNPLNSRSIDATCSTEMGILALEACGVRFGSEAVPRDPKMVFSLQETNIRAKGHIPWLGTGSTGPEPSPPAMADPSEVGILSREGSRAGPSPFADAGVVCTSGEGEATFWTKC